MGSKWIVALALLTGPGLAWGQSAPGDKKAPPKGPKGAAAKSALEEALAKALKDNPDLRVAAAKFHEAEAELSRARLLVMQKVVTQYRAREQAQAAVKAAEPKLARMRDLYAGRAIDKALVDEAEAKLVDAKAKLAAVEADMAYLLGKAPERPGPAAASQFSEAERAFREALRLLGEAHVVPVKGPMADKVRAALDRRVSFSFKGDSARTVLAALQKKAGGIHIGAVRVNNDEWSTNVTAELTDVPFGGALQLLADKLPDYRIVVREYGLLIAPKDRVPPGAVPLHEFWRGGGSADKPGVAKPAPKGAAP
jgi:hypothetical protein